MNTLGHSLSQHKSGQVSNCIISVNSAQSHKDHIVVKPETHHLNFCNSLDLQNCVCFKLQNMILYYVQTVGPLIHMFFTITMNAEIQKVKMIYFSKL